MPILSRISADLGRNSRPTKSFR
jgi:hypothetical protein